MYHHQNMNMEYNTKTKLIALKFYNIPIPTSYIVPGQFSIGKTFADFVASDETTTVS